MKFLMAIFGLGLLCAAWVAAQQMMGGEQRKGCGGTGGGGCSPKPQDCDGQGGCGAGGEDL